MLCLLGLLSCIEFFLITVYFQPGSFLLRLPPKMTRVTWGIVKLCSHCQGVSASEMTYIVLSGALNSTHSLTLWTPVPHISTCKLLAQCLKCWRHRRILRGALLLTFLHKQLMLDTHTARVCVCSRERTADQSKRFLIQQLVQIWSAHASFLVFNFSFFSTFACFVAPDQQTTSCFWWQWSRKHLNTKQLIKLKITF